MPRALADRLTQLKDETGSVYEAARTGIERDVNESRKSGQMAETFAWIIACSALLLAALVSALIVQSISVPLNQLTQGTRKIAEGKFFYRLDTSRRDEFGQLAKDFNTMTHRLDELDQMKKDFVSHVSHELKVPLASIQETNQLLLEQIPGPLNEKQQRLLDLNVASGRRLSAMISNLLDLSRMEAGVMEYELRSTDLTDLVQTVAAEFRPQADERAVKLEVETADQPLMIECDGDRIMQVLRNLLGNALKFSPKGKEIQVRVRRVDELPAGMPAFWRQRVLMPEDGRGMAVVSVADSGPGVPDAHKERIFEKFHQVKQRKKVPGQGAGLGLAISRTITEAHRGAIWVEDNPAGGSIFLLALRPAAGNGGVTYRKSSPV
jgi:signal transduction histidine kinase